MTVIKLNDDHHDFLSASRAEDGVEIDIHRYHRTTSVWERRKLRNLLSSNLNRNAFYLSDQVCIIN